MLLSRVDRWRRPPRRLAPAVRRVRRLKAITALLLLISLASLLFVFGIIAASADARFERDRIEDLVRRQAAAGQEELRYDEDGELQVGFADDLLLATGYPQLYVVELHRPARQLGRAQAASGSAIPDELHSSPRVVFGPRAPLWPELDAEVAELAAEAAAAGEEVSGSTVTKRVPPHPAENSVYMLALPPLRGAHGGAQAVVVGTASERTGQASHERLIQFMWWTAGTVLLFAGIVAFLLSRGRFWLIDRALEHHEQFLHDTAHELRAPVTSIRAITEAGLSGAEEPQQALQRASQLAQHTGEVIDDLMTLARIETRREPLQAEPIRLDQLVEVLVEQRSDDPPVELQLTPTVVTANPELLRRAVENLVDNAVRHGRAEDPAARVTVSVADGRVVVADRGPGVEPQLLTHLLERARSSKRASGAGLGLAIAGWVAQVHGGTLGARNQPDGGASFTLEVPVTGER